MIYRFGNAILDTGRHELSLDGVAVPVEPQVFRLLELLAQAAGRVVTRDEIMEAVWDGRIVSEATVSARIAAARRAVGDSGTEQRMIRTVQKVGLALVPPVASEGPAPRPQVAQTIRITVSADGTQIAYATHGQGPVLLRGGHWLGHLELDFESPVFGPLLAKLGRSFTVVRYDPRGTGLSQRGVIDLSLDRQVEDLAAVADAAGAGRFPIYAASQAVPVAVAFAARFPERVSALALCGGYALGRHHRQAPQERALEETQLTLIREGWGRSGSAFLNAFSTIYLPGATPEQLAHLLKVQLASADADSAVRLRQAIDRHDVSGELAKVQAPTLVVHASGDSVHPVSQGRMLAAGIPRAEFRQFDSPNHMMPPQEPRWEELTDAIIAHLSRA